MSIQTPRPLWRRRGAACSAALLLAGAIAVAPSLASASPTTPPLTIDLATAGVPEVRTALENGELTSVQLVQAYLDRIRDLSIGGPHLNAVRSINPDVYEEAAQLDAERAAGTVRGPLHGVPVLLKDNIDAVGMPTTAGSIALADSFPAEDAPLTAQLREAGAIILGKVNLSEFANFITSGMPSGYSSLGGQVLNPYDASQTPSGSSSGSGAAAAAGLATLTVGTETSGSILSPAQANSVVGVKPTVGLSSRTGIIPISSSQDTAGPMVKTVYDAAALLTAMTGIDPEDPATADNPLVDVDFTEGLSETALEGARIGFVSSNNALYQAALGELEAQGATLVPVSVGNTSAPSILVQEFKRDMNAYLSRLPDDAPIKTFDEIRQFNIDHPEGRKFGQVYFDQGAQVDLDDPDQLAAYEANRDRGITETRAAIDSVLESHDLDAIVSNSGTTGVGARAGYPSVSVPIGYAANNQRPSSMVFLGTAWSEPALLSLAYDYEQAAQVWRSPEQINPSLFRCATVEDAWSDAACLTIPVPGSGTPTDPVDPEPSDPGTSDPEPSESPEPTQPPAPSEPGPSAPPAPGPGTPVAPSTGALTDGARGGISVPDIVIAGSAVLVEVGERYAGTTVNGWLYSTPISLGAATVNAGGVVSFVIPADVEPGAHRLAVTEADGTLIGWAAIEVLAPGTPNTAGLAATGGEVLVGVGVGAVALGAGGALALMALRKRRVTA
ncbi:amidase family protein [Microbacterium album]|uniref:Amidase domain-containing protein n=1 Tax=Microbacterium album TaxID=2053191 RepID=A0A917MP81_9MICO|nr:amidase family protein [Microbacterium album]GGH45800.1 hypothetical protein GCM10010921_21430 [Microbacterium album]